MDESILHQKKTKKTFPAWRKAKKWAKNTILSLAASLMLTGCPQSCIPTPIGLPPVAGISSNKSSTEKGGSVNIKTTGTAKNGKSIISYGLESDYNGNGIVDGPDETITQDNPFDINPQLNYAGTAKFYSFCTDDAGLTSDKAKLEILVTEPTTTTIPQQQLPTADFSEFERDFKLVDGQQKEYTLPVPLDSNGVEVPYKAVRVVSGNEYINSIGIDIPTRKLTAKPKPISQETSCQLEFDFGTTESGTATYSTSIIPIDNLCNIEGQIESNWDAEGVTKPGEVKGFAEGDRTKKVIDYTAPDGRFNVQANAPATNLTLKGRFTEPSGTTFVCQSVFDATKDYTGIKLIGEPWSNFCTKLDFLDWCNYTSMDGHIEGWDLPKFEGVELVYQHPAGNKGIFNSTNRRIVKETLIASDGGEAFFNNKISLDNKVQEDDASTTNFHYLYNGYGFSALPNWIVIISVDGLVDASGESCAGLTSVGYLNNNRGTHTINRALIMLDSNRLSPNGLTPDYLKKILLHEFKHAADSPGGEGTGLVNPYSVMSQNLTQAGLADIDKAKLTYGRYPFGTPFNDVLQSGF